MTTEHHNNTPGMTDDVTEYVTVMIGSQLFGLPISRVQDVFMPEKVTRVPLSVPEIAGVLNLRGRIVTAIDMRRRLGLPRLTRASTRWQWALNIAASTMACSLTRSARF